MSAPIRHRVSLRDELNNAADPVEFQPRGDLGGVIFLSRYRPALRRQDDRWSYGRCIAFVMGTGALVWAILIGLIVFLS